MTLSASDMLKEIARESGLTQFELSQRLSTTPVTINSWINAKSAPRHNAYSRIQELYFEIIGAATLAQDLYKNTLEEAMALTSPLAKLIKDKQLYDKVLVEFTYNTNSIEGSTMTYDDTHEVLIEQAVLTGRTQAEQLEAKNHQTTFLWLITQLSNGKLEITHDLLLSINEKLLHSVDTNAGRYRSTRVRINKSKTITTNPANVYTKIDELLPLLNESIDRKHAIQHIARTHAEFEKIHPFHDGNGRTGRLLMLVLAANNNMMIPLVTRAKRAAYYSYLEQAQTKAQYEGIEYFIASSMLTMKDVLV